MIYLELFWGFLKVGCFSFGGAYGAIPLIRDVALEYGWLDEATLTYMIAVGESTPGPIMVNLATYVGLSQGGLPGAILATITVVLPAFFIILLFMFVLKKVWGNSYVQTGLEGVRSCVIGIVLAVGVYMVLDGCIIQNAKLAVNIRTLLLTLFLGAVWFGIKYGVKKALSPILLILLSAVLGIVVWGI